ncbi:MAG: M50 family metallopeptidase [Anaerolineae bacterium]
MNLSILSLLIFIAVFALVVFIHEFGHFIVARLLKVEVEEFGFGLPPRMLTLFHWKGTSFTLNWLPIGGFVRPKGENDPSVPGGLGAASPWTRLAVLLAGPTMNLLLAVVGFSVLFFQIGVPDYTKVQIAEVMPGSPAAAAGVQPDDIITSVNGVKITDSTQLHDVIYGNLDKPLQVTLLRHGQTVTVTATPSSKRAQGQGALGISMGPALVPSGSAIDAVRYGSMAVYEQMRLLVLLPAQMLRGQASPESSRFVGLKGIYDLFGQAVSRDVQSREPLPTNPSSPTPTQTPTYFTLQLIGILTISLGVLNLFPFPALDGGRIMFVLPELLLHRRIPPQWENGINAVGMALLLAFMVYVNVMDFVNPAIVTLPR